MLEKARKNLIRVYAMGIRNGRLSVKSADMVWKALVRSVIEYGAEVWGNEKWPEAEKVQIEMGKRILRCHYHCR